MTKIRQLFILAFVACLVTSCAPAPSNSNTVVVQATPSPSASPSVSPSPATTETASVQITLPLLDALLADNKFVARLKKDAKLSDEQIDSIKKASSSAVVQLRESNAEDLDGNNTDARQRAAEQLRSRSSAL